MKKIIIPGITGMFLAVLVLVLQGRENNDRIQMHGLFNDKASSDAIKTKQEGSEPGGYKIARKDAEVKKNPKTRTIKKASAARNEEIRKALKIEPAEAKRAEVKKILIKYRKKRETGQSYKDNAWNPDREKYKRPTGKSRYRYDEDDDDDD